MGKRSRKKLAADVPPAQATAITQPAAWTAHDWHAALVLIAAIFLTYTSVWPAGYVWDDSMHLTKNPCIVGPLGLVDIWTSSQSDVCPLTLTTFWLEHKLWGLAPLPYHLVNVLIHAGCAVVLWRVLRALAIPGAWLGAALWALHPVQVESVAWISEMKNTESGLFFLLSILFYVQDLNSTEKVPSWRRRYVLALIFAACAMAAKSSTVVLPLVLCLCAWWLDGRWQWRRLLRIAPVFALALAASLESIGVVAQRGFDSSGNAPRTVAERVAVAGDALWFYLGKLVWPHPLMAVHPRWVIDATQWYAFVPSAAAVALGIAFWHARNGWGRPWFFAYGYFAVALLPTLGLVDHYFIRFTFVAYHFQYLAAMGPLALAGAALSHLQGRLLASQRKLLLAADAALLLVLAGLSWTRAWAYESQGTLWTDELAKDPASWVGYNDLGAYESSLGHTDAAIGNFQKAIQVNPHDFEAHDQLGLIFAQEGRANDAIAEYQKALEVDPGDLNALISWGNLLAQAGQLDAALALYRKAVGIKPDSVQGLNNVGLILMREGRLDEATAAFRKSLAANPADSTALFNLGNVSLREGDAARAIDCFQRAVDIEPGYADARAGLGTALLQAGRIDEAIAEYRRALALSPNLYEALVNLGMAYLHAGRIDEAVNDLKSATAFYPQSAEAHNGLGIALYQKGEVNDAIAQFEEVLRLKPGDTEAQDNLVRVRGSSPGRRP